MEYTSNQTSKTQNSFKLKVINSPTISQIRGIEKIAVI